MFTWMKLTMRKIRGFTSDLKPSLHCCKAAASAMKVLSMIRSFVNISKKLIFLYKTYVRPHLEYCVPIWSPYHVKDIKILEKVQKRAIKLVRGHNNLPYEQRLRSLDMYSLFCQCQHGELIEVFKILNGYYNIDRCYIFFTPSVTSTRGHRMKLFKSYNRLNTRANFFTQRVINNWNSLPNEVVSANSIGSFKSKLDDYWKQIGHGYSLILIICIFVI